MNFTPDQEPESIAEREARLAAYNGPDAVITAAEMRDRVAKMPKIANSFSTGLYRLDEAVGEIQTGELIALGGMTKHGKTLLAQTITINLAKAGVPCLWFTFEVPVPQFLSQIPPDVHFYLPAKLDPYRLEWFEERVMESHLKYGTRVVFADNLHHLFDFALSRNPSIDIGIIIRALKRMAVNLNVVVFILCHSKKPGDSKIVTDPSEWDLRDSSFIPQESDSTWMIQRKQEKETKEFTNRCFLKICNHRRTGTMSRKIHLIKTGQMLEEDVTHYSADQMEYAGR